MTQAAQILLPQFAGDQYKLQVQQGLAQQLMGNAMQPQQMGMVGAVMPRMSPWAGVAQVAQGALGGYEANQAAQKASQLGGAQFQALQGMFGGPGAQAPVNAPAAPSVTQTPAPSQGPAAPSPDQMAAALAGGGSSGMPAPAAPQTNSLFSVPSSTPPASGQNPNGSGTPQGSALFSLNGQPSTPQPAQANAPAQPANNQPQPTGLRAANGTNLNPWGYDSNTAARMYMTDPEGYMKDVRNFSQPTDTMKNNAWMGITPQQAGQNYAAQQQKDQSIALNGQILQPDGKGNYVSSANVPQQIAGFSVGQRPDGTWQYSPVAGGTQAITDTTAATAKGNAMFEPTQVYDPATGGMVYSNKAAVAQPGASSNAPGGAPAPLRNNNPGALMPGGRLAQYPDQATGLQALDNNLQQYGKQGVNTIAGVVSKWAPPTANNTAAYIQDVSQRLGIPANQPIDLSQPVVRQALSTAISLHENGPQGVFGAPGAAPTGAALMAAPPLGATANADAQAKNQQDFMSKDWTQQQATNASAQTAIARLQTLNDLASKASIGGGSDQLNYMNHLLAQIGVQPANDAATATDLFNKNVNQITTALTGDGMSTDQARTMVQAAYPNSHMTPDAVHEATANLTSNLQMAQAKTNYLSGYYNQGDAKGYSQAKTNFETNADPRIWQLQSAPPAQQAQIVQALAPAQAAQLLQKRQALRTLGVIQ